MSAPAARHCHRTPLVGERVYLYAQAMVCELCRPRRREAPQRSELVRSPEHKRAVRVRTRSGRTPGAVDPVELTITIDRPREEVFEYLADIANHPEFTDHYLKDWHLTRVDSYGRGAGARYRMDAPLQRFGWSDLTFVEVDAPRRDRRRRPRRQVQPHQDLRELDARARQRRHPRRVRVRDRTGAARPTASSRPSASAAGSSASPTRACGGCGSILEDNERRGTRATVAGI